MRAIDIAKTAAVVAVVAGAAACGGSSSMSPTSPTTVPPVTPANQAPVIASMSAGPGGYRTGRLNASVTDPDGQVTSVAVDWGDGRTDSVTSGFGSIVRTHEYGSAQAFTVTLRATDDAGATAQMARSVSITVPPRACVGIEVIELCAQSTSDFAHVHVALVAGDIELVAFNVSNGNPSYSGPLPNGGTITLAVNFDTGRITMSGKTCTVPFVVCSPFSKTLQL